MTNNTSTNYAELKLPELEGEVVANSELHQLLQSRGADINAFLIGSQSIKEDKARDILVGQLPGGANILCKIYKEQGLVARLKCCFLQSRAARGHCKTKQLLQLGYNTPQTLGFIVTGKYSRSCKSIQFTQFLQQSETLEEKLRSAEKKSFDLTGMLGDLAKLFSRLHGDGYVHGDAKLSNILLLGNDIYFIDLDGSKKISKQWTPARDVARLLVGLSEEDCSQDDRLSLFNTYCDNVGVSKEYFRTELTPLIEKFQNRHQHKYGIQPQKVF